MERWLQATVTDVCALLGALVKSSTSSLVARVKVWLVIFPDIRHRSMTLLPLQARNVDSAWLRIFTLEPSFSSSKTL